MFFNRLVKNYGTKADSLSHFLLLFTIEVYMIITIKDLWKIYPMGKYEVQALKGINLIIEKGNFVAVAGPSGAGKTTLMNIIGLIDNFNSGSLIIDNIEIKNQNRKELTRLRLKLMGFVFQSFNLLPVLNVYENVELPLIISGKRTTKPERQKRVEYLLEAAGLSDRSKFLPSELSGGQQQRVAIARALVTKPKIVIADEPTANLDSETGEKILLLMKEINQNEKTTFIFSTHNPEIWKMADHIVFIQDGIIKSEERR